jgi:hypothetical protein
MPISIKGFYATLSLNGTQLNNALHYAEYHYAFFYTKCHYTECRGAIPKDAFTRPTKTAKCCDFDAISVVNFG